MSEQEQEIFDKVKASYGHIAELAMSNQNAGCCGTESSNSKSEDVLSLGCYNGLVTKAGIKEGQTVVDLGSGPGRDLIEAAKIIGEAGKAIGIDMTDQMIELGKKNTADLKNVEIIKGNLQEIPLDDNTVDVIISNCVFNLTANKYKAFSEAYRVLKPGGRIVESDVALDYELSDEERNQQQVYSGCIGGAVSIQEYVHHMERAGFKNIKAEIQFTGNYLLGGKQYEYKSVLFSGEK